MKKNHILRPFSPLFGFNVALEAELETRAEGLVLNYCLTGDIDRIRWPREEFHGFRDQLWTSTCFELFIGSSSSTAYEEWNFSLNGAWARFNFSDYRSCQTADVVPTQPLGPLGKSIEPNRIILATSIPYAYSRNITYSLNAVLEDSTGHLSYWAIIHSSDRPDFHDPRSRLELEG